MLCLTPEDLFASAHAFAGRLNQDDIVLLYGALGAGKTLFVKGLCSGLGIDPDTVSSPTFTLMHNYTAACGAVAHFDLYRLSDAEEFFLIGGEELLGRQLCLIEWPELIEDILPAQHIRVCIEISAENGRYLSAVRLPDEEKLI